MAMQKVNTEFRPMVGGDVAEGYLLARGHQLFMNEGKESLVPTLILKEKKKDGTLGIKFKVLLGSTLLEDAELLVLNAFTVVKKAKEKKRTRKGREVQEFELLQDTADLLPGAAAA